MYTLDKFQVNLLSNSGKRFLVTELQLEMESEEVLPELDTKKAVIRDHIISILSSKNIEEVSTPKGKDKLKDEIVSDVNSFLADGEIKNVYFTKFVMQ
jgi:flagellar FliL protein